MFRLSVQKQNVKYKILLQRAWKHFPGGLRICGLAGGSGLGDVVHDHQKDGPASRTNPHYSQQPTGHELGRRTDRRGPDVRGSKATGQELQKNSTETEGGGLRRGEEALLPPSWSVRDALSRDRRCLLEPASGGLSASKLRLD